ncbi:MAG: DEAD/DEAH box helicase family protein [Chloroflexota bacterium]|nr:DEAD/DEAH box helicase family protein [Chloroflexota bacterium]
MLTSSPFFASHSAAHLIQETLHTAHFVRIATAYFEASGYGVLQDVLSGKRLHLLIGRDEGGRDRLQAVLDEFVESFLARPLERRTQAMRQMLTALENNQLLISVGDTSDMNFHTLLDARYLYQHAKLYMADEAAVVVTSANCSHHGLVRSIEAGIRVTDADDVAYFVERFDAYFAQAESITQALIERLRELLAAYPPYYVYARTLLELYDLPDEQVPPQLPPLSDYQKPYVSRTLEALNNYRGAMMIASTGLGKTVMAAHVAAYLRMQGTIDRVLIICPAGLKENWRRHMGMARIFSVEFSYSTFSLKDPKRYFSLRQLEYELRATDTRTLVLIDESHHLRNPRHAAQRQKERYQRVMDAIHEAVAYALLLTATPYSRGIKDVNAQLKLLPRSIFAAKHQLMAHERFWTIQEAQQLPELPPCPTLTTPVVVRYYSETDDQGHRYVVFTKGGKRYFPHRINLRSVIFENELDPVLINLLKGHLLDVRQEDNHDVQMSFGGEWGEPRKGRGAGLRKAEVMKQFCSSPAQIEDLFRKLRKEDGFAKTRFVHQAELRTFVDHNVPDVQRNRGNDVKFRQLLEIINQTPGKLVVFCHYRQTARALSEHLKQIGVKADTTEGQAGERVDALLRRFAPVANEVLDAETQEDDVKVLVVTSALAEGYNLQDASVLVNYDLPWTVLMLAQRMGRVLRPWSEPREITIYNFVPAAMLNPDIQIAMNWHQRLMQRSEQHRALADIPVMQTNGNDDEGYAMAELARALHKDPETSLDLDDVLQFIERADIGTSSFFTDLLQIDTQLRKDVMKLHAGFRSAMTAAGKPRLFLLFTCRKRVHAVLFDQKGDILLDSEQRDRIMQQLRCTPQTPLSELLPPDDRYDTWMEQARERWCHQHSVLEDEMHIICAIALMR